jgi:hypothetical protein
MQQNLIFLQNATGSIFFCNLKNKRLFIYSPKCHLPPTPKPPPSPSPTTTTTTTTTLLSALYFPCDFLIGQ